MEYLAIFMKYVAVYGSLVIFMIFLLAVTKNTREINELGAQTITISVFGIPFAITFLIWSFITIFM